MAVVFVRAMSEVWMLAWKALAKAQHRQKVQHDKSSKNADFRVGDRVLVFMPGMKSGPAYKLSCIWRLGKCCLAPDGTSI